MNINYKQLAFILDIEPVKALEKILYTNSKVTGKNFLASCGTVKQYLFTDQGKKKVRNNLPESYDIGLLAIHLNIPLLQQAVDDIRNNFLKRPFTKRWILCDFPEKELRTKDKTKIKIPDTLASLIREEDIKIIHDEWKKRYGI